VYSSEEDRSNAEERINDTCSKLVEDSEYDDEYSTEKYMENDMFVLEVNYTINK
jgi:hypothetical protein